MFFYTSLFVASIIIALVVVWLYNAMKNVGKVVYRAILPSSKNNPASHVKKRVLHATVNDTRTPWGWQGKGRVAGGRNAQRKSHHNKPVANPAGRSMQNVGWPYREEKLSSFGKAHTAQRKAKPKRTNPKTASKPWGW